MLPVPGVPPQFLFHQDPAHPFVPNGTGRQPTYRVADLDANPNVKQWAKDVMKKDNDEVLAGKIGYTPGTSCRPAGVPALMLSGGPFYFIQTPREVTIVMAMDHQVRHVYMDVPHSAGVKPSWYGESVGHYEGDTLVIDTIDQSTKTFVDNFRTPHSEKLHVIESGLGIKEKGVVLHRVEIEVLLETGDQHPIERKSQQDRKSPQHENVDDLAPDAPRISFGHQVTSAR